MEKFGTFSNNATHLFMDNGKICVPDDEYPYFLKMYYKAITNNDHPCIVEKTGTSCLFRFFLDIDVKNPNIIEDVLYNIYNDANKILNMIGDIYICNEKMGLHIIYNKVVDYNEAIEYYNEICNKIPTIYNKYIDKSVYKTGLRMIYASKKDEIRYYVPYNNELNWDTFKHSIIRVKGLKQETQIQQNIELAHHKPLDNFIAKHFNIEDVHVISVKKLGNYVSCITNSKFCLNINDFHKNAKVYFVFDIAKKSCYQKCFCSCTKSLPFTSCNNYRSKIVSVPYLIISYLQMF
jgi:tetratricopeptide (TPR) repeat protein